MNTSVFKGSATAIITPMNMDGSISYKKMEELLEYQISHHTNAIVVAGTTGESVLVLITQATHNFYVKTRKMRNCWKFQM